MEEPALSPFSGYRMNQQQPLTPLSPSLPTSMPPVPEPIPTLPITPPSTEDEPENEAALATAVHVLSTEATALSCLSRLYQTDPVARGGFVKSVESVARSIGSGGKLVVVGTGKSGKIGEKVVATMNSLGVLSVFLHPIEALHGDLGVIRTHDTLLLITYSGRTPELLALLPHLPQTSQVIVLTAHTTLATSPLTRARANTILLPAPIHEPEETSFGVCAPTTSTTVALALGDALAIAIAQKIHVEEGRGPKEVFKSHHPGGAIGMKGAAVPGPKLINELATHISDMPRAYPGKFSDEVTILDCVLAAVRSPNGWMRLDDELAIPPRRIQRLSAGAMGQPINEIKGLIASADSWVTIPVQSTVEEVRNWVLGVRAQSPAKEQEMLGEGTVLGLVRDGRVEALVEVEELFEDG
ncbi:hypothetical protein FGG08_006070 [Glutinoglossum americanum]|uniref:SIS domain-containing protein n=1 Tax=Glutinoglossum americanum TaxID=1670608 RepID=A0A9P8HX46_9PEZI|nr:hypothetical protein FGG08_006070 [Glutinoglossum americanum]